MLQEQPGPAAPPGGCAVSMPCHTFQASETEHGPPQLQGGETLGVVGAVAG